jgi:hypothetical protein
MVARFRNNSARSQSEKHSINFEQLARDRCYDFKNISTKNLAKILTFLAQTTASFCKNAIITLVFEKNAIFPPKIGKNRRK